MLGVRVRPAVAEDYEFLCEMLGEAVAWRGTPPPSRHELEADPRLRPYVDGWPREGDAGVVAEDERGEAIGAAWHRRFDDTDHGYGYVDAATPELTVAVRRDSRGGGVGTRLLESLLERSRSAGVGAVSLSVEKDNPAVRLYERAGFVRVGEDGNAWTMRLDLVGDVAAARR